ncbi:MAG TPA: ABC transporter permease, partial [Gemmatimonadales bacterium]|nr:ABC transporter permease [Gemmatimonadales bacterium]
AHWLHVIARLKPGVTPAAADAEFQAVVRQLQVEYPVTNRVMGADLVPLQEFLIGDIKTPLLILQASVGLLLLIACANVANLLLAQAVGREREMSLRLTLGARQARLVRQAMTESLVLAALGGIAGLFLGLWGTRALAALQPAHMLPVRSVPMDLGVLAWISLITTLTGLLFGIAPALWAARRQPADVLREGSKGSAGVRTRRWTAGLVAFEVAVALVLTVGAGLLVRSFWRLTRLDPGLDSDGVLVVAVRLPTPYDTTWKQLKFFQALLERTQAIPGVTAAGFGTVAPFGTVAYTSDFHIAGRPPEEYGSEVARDYVTPDYFRTLGIPLKSGRVFDATDRQGSAGVVIINESLARQFFKGQDPVGQRITFDRIPDSTSVYRTIVGVVGDVRQRGLALEPQIEAYEVLGQQSNSYMTLVVHASGDQPGLLTQVRNAMAAIDPGITPAETWQLSTLVQRSIARQRFLMVLLLVFAATGVILAVVGVYGVMAQLAARRTREMGIRLALGAQMSQVRWLVLREAVRLLAIGLGAGLLVAYMAGRGMRALLYDIAPADPVTFLAVTAMLIATGLVASWLPAVRASRADPATSLRSE